MRYFYEPKTLYFSQYGSVYECDHPAYSKCTLYKGGSAGLAVIQQRYDPITKHTWWSNIDPWLTDELYLHERFRDYFRSHAGIEKDGLYPTVTVRQIMWAFKMKPIKKEAWETVFDKSPF